MVNFSADIEGEKVFFEAVKLGEDIEDYQAIGIWEEVDRVLRNEVWANWFRSEGRKTWPELSPKYAAWKEQHYPFAGILQRERKLEFSLTKRNEDSVYEPSPKQLLTGTSVRYAKAHMKRYKNRPARPPIPTSLSEDERKMVVKALKGKVRSQARRRAWVQTELEAF